MASNDLAYEDYKQPSKNNDQPTMEFHKVLQRYIPIVGINLLIILILGYFISPLSKVASVSVEGNNAVYVQQIIDESGVRGGDSVIGTIQEREQIENNVTSQLEQVANTSIEVTGINDIMIQVEEFDTVSYIAQDGSYLRVLENGTVLDDVYDVSIGNQPVLSNFQEGEALNLMIEEISQLDAPILNLISEIELVESRSNPLFIRVFMNNGNRVLSSIPSFSEKIPFYPQMVQAVGGRQGVFDMEAGVYFIPFASGEEEINAETEVDESERQALEEFTG
jgi:cell division protein FtsQ